MSQHEVVLLLGSNLGDPELNIKNAINAIENKVGRVLTKSELLTTIPVEFASNNNFCNIALLIKTQFSPIKLLKLLKGIEAEMGRKQDSRALGAYSDRIIDIDIVTFENLQFESVDLVIPHQKHLFERDFSKNLLQQIAQKHN